MKRKKGVRVRGQQFFEKKYKTSVKSLYFGFPEIFSNITWSESHKELRLKNFMKGKKMKKLFILAPAFVATAMIFTGCAMCTDPISVACTENTHNTDKLITPESMAFTAPLIVPTRDTFRPTFAAGTKRMTAVGNGTSREEATNDAFMKFKAAAECDYIVAVNISIVKSTHPTWRFFATTNYTVTITGLPIYLDKLVREEAAPTASVQTTTAQTPPPPPTPALSKEDVTLIIRKEIASLRERPAHQCNFGLLKLSDIDVQIRAKGSTPEGVGVTFPAKKINK